MIFNSATKILLEIDGGNGDLNELREGLDESAKKRGPTGKRGPSNMRKPNTVLL